MQSTLMGALLHKTSTFGVEINHTLVPLTTTFLPSLLFGEGDVFVVVVYRQLAGS